MGVPLVALILSWPAWELGHFPNMAMPIKQVATSFLPSFLPSFPPHSLLPPGIRLTWLEGD